MFADEDPVGFNAQIEMLTRTLEASPDVGARRSARELVQLILEFHGIGLRRLLQIIDDGPSSLRQRIAADPVIAGLLALHELETSRPVPATGQEQGIANSPLIQISRRAVPPPASPTTDHGEEPSRCERCGAPVGDSHHHHVDLVSRRLSCSCRACWLLSGSHGRQDSLRAVPDRYVRKPAFRLTRAQWDALQVPVATAFFMFNSVVGRTIAFYPSPAGATESALSLEAWRDVEDSNPWLAAVDPDVEAILVRRNDTASDEAFIVPIDACYSLVGRIRLHWSGFDGGEAVRAEIDRFFSDVAARSAGALESIVRPS